MQIHVRYFKWNHDYDMVDIKLGDRICVLMEKEVVRCKKVDGNVEYKYTKNENIWIGVNEGKVDYIYFTNYSGNYFININVDDFEYPSTEKITELLSSKFEYLSEFTSLKDHHKFLSGDYLQLIFRDHFLINMIVRRK